MSETCGLLGLQSDISKDLGYMDYAPVLEAGRRLEGSRPLRRFPMAGSRAFFHLLLLVDMVAVWQPVPT